MALVRYDFYVWKYESSSNGLFKNTKSIVAYTYASSVIDHTKVTKDQLLQAIYNSLGNNATPESVTEYVKKLQHAWEALEATSPHKALTAFTKSVNERGSLKALKQAEALPELVHA
jgi:lysyl-tRNA synthetase class I